MKVMTERNNERKGKICIVSYTKFVEITIYPRLDYVIYTML